MALRIILRQTSGVEIYKWFGYLSIIAGVLFFLFVLNLAVFHSYLISKNITTWEQLSWKKISYLQDWEREYGSPFDLGIIENFKLVFMNGLKEDDFFLWKMPYW